MDDSKFSSKRPRPKKSTPKAADSSSPKLTKDDISSLEMFCNGLSYEAISFETWQQTLSSLDLVVPVWIGSDLAKSGGETAVRCSRSVQDSKDSKSRRLPVTVNVVVPPAVTDGHRILFAAQGDQIAEDVGNLIVIIKLR